VALLRCVRRACGAVRNSIVTLVPKLSLPCKTINVTLCGRASSAGRLCHILKLVMSVCVMIPFIIARFEVLLSWTAGISIPGGGKRFFSSPQLVEADHSDRAI
jgi:hypothetical protein